MRVLLTAAVDPGDLDSGSYTDVKLTKWDWDKDDAAIVAHCQWGAWSDPTWTAGIKQQRYYLTSTSYDNVAADVSEASEVSCQSIERAILDELVLTGDLVGVVNTGA